MTTIKTIVLNVEDIADFYVWRLLNLLGEHWHGPVEVVQ